MEWMKEVEEEKGGTASRMRERIEWLEREGSVSWGIVEWKERRRGWREGHNTRKCMRGKMMRWWHKGHGMEVLRECISK